MSNSDYGRQIYKLMESGELVPTVGRMPVKHSYDDKFSRLLFWIYWRRQWSRPLMRSARVIFLMHSRWILNKPKNLKSLSGHQQELFISHSIRHLLLIYFDIIFNDFDQGYHGQSTSRERKLWWQGGCNQEEVWNFPEWMQTCAWEICWKSYEGIKANEHK